MKALTRLLILCLSVSALQATQLVKTVNGLAIASVKTVDQLAIASVKTVDGLDNTSSGGGGGPYTFVKSQGNVFESPGTTMTNILPTVTAGNLIVIQVKHEGAPTTLTISDGTTSFTAATKVNHSSGQLSQQFFYLLSSVASGTVTYTCTLGAARDFKAMIAWEFDPTGTAAFDTEPSGGGSSGNGGTLTSGNMTTTANDTVCLGAYAEFSSDSFTTMQINGVAAAGVRASDNSTTTTQTRACSWYRIPTATFTGAATGTGVVADDWIINAIAFK